MSRLKKEDQIKINELFENFFDNDFETLKKIGNIYYKAGCYKKSTYYYKKAIEVNPNYTDAYINLGHAFYYLNKFYSAIKCYKTAIVLDNYPIEKYILYYDLATCYYGLNKVSEAVENYLKSIEHNSDFFSSYYNLGCLYYDNNKYEDAIKYLSSAAKINKKDGRVYYYLAVSYSKIKNSKNAITNFEKAIKNGYINSEVYYDFAWEYGNLKLYNEAIVYYKKSIELNPNHKHSCNNLAIIYTKLQEYDNSIFYYEKSIEIDKNQPYVLNNLGILYENYESNHTKAINTYLRAIELAPSMMSAYANIGWVYIDLMLYTQALEYFIKAYKIDPNYPKLLFQIGQLLDITKEKINDDDIPYKTAIEFVRESKNKGYDIASIYYASYFYDNLISFEEARDVLLNIAEQDFNSEAWFELGRLYSLKDHLDLELAHKYFNKAKESGIECSYEINQLTDNSNLFLDLLNTKENIFEEKQLEEFCNEIFGDLFTKFNETEKSFIYRAIREYKLEINYPMEVEDFSSCIVYLAKPIESLLNSLLGKQLYKYILNNNLDSTDVGQQVVSEKKDKTLKQIVYHFRKENRTLNKIHVHFLLEQVFKDGVFGSVNESINLTNYVCDFVKTINKFTDKRNSAAHQGVVSRDQCEKWFDKILGSGRMLQNFLAKLR